MNKIKLLVLFVMLAALMAAVGIVGAQDDEGEGEEPSGPIVYNSNQSDPEPRRVDEMMVEMWNERNPDMQVEHSIINHEDFKQQLRVFLTSDPSPDVLTWFAGNRTRFFHERGLLHDFSDAWNEEGFGDQFAPGFQDLATNYGDSEGAYFLPGIYYWWGVYYRPSLFEEAGIEEPPETWEEFLGTCDALNEAGITPVTIGTRFRWTAAGWFDYLNLRVNGPEFHLDLMNFEVPYTDERVKEVFDYWQQLFEHDCFIDNPAAYSWQEGVQFMANGDAAMYLIGDFIRDEVSANFPDMSDDLDFFQFPIINEDVPVAEEAPTDGWFISANADNPEAAEEFLQWLGSQEAQEIYLEELNRLPTRTDVDLSGVDDITRKGVEMIQSADVITQFYDRDTSPPMADAGMDAFLDFWDNPDDIDSILEELEDERQRVMEEAEQANE